MMYVCMYVQHVCFIRRVCAADA